MVEWSATDRRVWGIGTGGTVELRVEGWTPSNDAVPIGRSVDAILAGETDEITLPDVDLRADETSIEPPKRFGPGRHTLDISAALSTALAFEGRAILTTDGTLTFREPTVVTIGFRDDRERETITVPGTAAGLAAAVSAAATSIETVGPERSHPASRPPTPIVEFGRRSIPNRLETASERRPVLSVPPSAQAVLVAAPLAYYLGARVETTSGSPQLATADRVRELPQLPALSGAVSEWLRRLVDLDCRLRQLPCEGDLPIPERLDADRLREKSPVERLRVALETELDDTVEWPLTVYVDDDVESGRWLPYVLDRLSLVVPAEASELDPKALLRRSLDEFFRGEAPNVEAVDPSLSASRSHAWLAEGTPIDAYSLVRPAVDSPAADGTLSIDVICNDLEMAAEQQVAEAYRDFTGFAADVRLHERLTVSKLASVLESTTDFVHFIGHCERNGLRCPDGTLAAADLDRCGARSFFLNACGSYYEGHELVRRGATVGGVTLTRVLEEQAATVGSAFARLLAVGVPFAPALRIARGEIITGQDYVVVGDGTHSLVPAVEPPAVVSATEIDGDVLLRYDRISTVAGRSYVDPFGGDRRRCGEVSTARLSHSDAAAFLDGRRLPVVWNGRLRWADELANEIESRSFHAS